MPKSARQRSEPEVSRITDKVIEEMQGWSRPR